MDMIPGVPSRTNFHSSVVIFFLFNFLILCYTGQGKVLSGRLVLSLAMVPDSQAIAFSVQLFSGCSVMDRGGN